MKKLHLTFFKIILSLVILFSFTPLVYAQLGEYAVLTPLPGTTAPCADTKKGPDCTLLERYLPAVFSLTIGIGAALAVVMITYGGVIYATTDAISGKEEGKKLITDAIVGLLLIIGSYVILITINPKMVDFSLLLPRPRVIVDGGGITSGTGRVLPGYLLTADQVTENTRVVTLLQNAGIGINNNGTPCTNGGISLCTNVVNLPGEAINGVIALKNAPGCNCNVTITGGTEGGHVTHGPNLPRLDLRKDAALDAYIRTNAFRPYVIDGNGDTVYTVRTTAGTFTFVDEKGGIPHWHVDFAGK